MSAIRTPAAELRSIPIASATPMRDERYAFLRRAGRFVAIGLLLYGALYGIAEWLVRQHAHRNRFFAVQSAPHDRYDYVVLGASHAAVFDYRDMNSRLQAASGARVLNLANVGAGVVPNRLVYDYFRESRATAGVVYVLDSFAFYSREWNEERVADTRLYLRAPFDPTLARLLLRQPGARKAGLAYVSGFPKINDRDRFAPDLFPGEGSTFDRVYRPIPQLDRQRLQYLYPADLSADVLSTSPYLAAFEALVREVTSRGERFIVIRPPLPDRIRGAIPHEDSFDAEIRALLSRHRAEFHDLSRVNNDPELFYDSDHLNRAGVEQFIDRHLAPLLQTPTGVGARLAPDLPVRADFTSR
jgi:hypothetical protein